ncbi:SCAN domain-containing protein 3 [Trichonephila clavipes]|nr:SCAN domain-containing protein 3 [Trichonephila clavipes]
MAWTHHSQRGAQAPPVRHENILVGHGHDVHPSGDYTKDLGVIREWVINSELFSCESVDVNVRVNAYIKIFVCTCVIGTQDISGSPSHVSRSTKKWAGLMSSEELMFSRPISVRDIQFASELAYV